MEKTVDVLRSEVRCLRTDRASPGLVENLPVEHCGSRRLLIRVFCGLILWAGMALFAFHASTHMVSAGDTWVALACGRHHANHGVNTAEPFSFNSHKPGPTDEQLKAWPQWTHGIIRKIHPTGWINQNWLTHLIFYELVSLFGSADNYNYDALVWWKFAVYIGAVFCVYGIGRTLGAAPLLSAVSACMAMLVGRTFFDIRPAAFSNLLVPAYILVLALTAYRNIRYIWLLVPLVVFWANVHGGYIYAFIMLVPFWGLNFISLPFKNRLIAMDWKGLRHTLAAGTTAFLAMLIFNPFHLTNLTHTFEISISKHAESWRMVKEWRPAFDFLDKTRTSPNLVGDEEAFGVMCIVLLIVLLLWSFAHLLRPHFETRRRARAGADMPDGWQNWPKIDLAMLTIVLFTTYMAVQSRRFISIAGSVACPFITLMFQQAFVMFGMRLKFLSTGQFTPPVVPVWIRKAAYGVFAAAVVVLGCWWGYRFKTIYLDPWPTDPVYNSVFMRMTASNLKPIEICRFINDNNISGRMFNYWTEGGALAFGQRPDKKTGKIPLQLFMDGRAQAAYNHNIFQLWQYIYSGGPTAQNLYNAGRNATSADHKEMGKWINRQFDKFGVWVVVIPKSESQSDFILALRTTGNWKTAYYDQAQLMMVNGNNPRGRTLIENIINDKAVFPNEFARNITLTRLILELRTPELLERLEDCAPKAFQIQPAFAAILELIHSGVYPPMKQIVIGHLERYLDDFRRNKENYRRTSGYIERLRSAAVSASQLAGWKPQLGPELTDIVKEYNMEIDRINNKSVW